MSYRPDPQPLHEAATRAPETAAWLLRTDHGVLLDLHGRIVATDAAGGELVTGDDYPTLWARAGADAPDAAATAEMLHRAIEERDPPAVLEHRGASGDRSWRVTARHLVSTNLTGVFIVVEVTDRRAHDDEMPSRAALLDHIDAAVIATDPDGVVTAWNRGAEQLYGWSTEEAVGRAATDFIVPASEQVPAKAAMAEMSDTGTWEGEFTLLRRDGSRFLAHVRDTVVRDPDGTVTGHVGASADVTTVAATTAQLARSVAELGAITHSIGDAVCTLDEDQRVSFANPAAFRFFHRPVEDVIGQPLSQWLYESGPGGDDDHQPLKRVTETDPASPTACWVAGPEGPDVAAEYIATPLRDVGGGLLPGWVVVLRDVTERRAQEAELAGQLAQVQWLRAVRDALDNDGFELHAQPIVSLASGLVVQHELLLRMRDPDHPGQLIAPGRFLPTAETYGLAPAIDHWVLEQGFAIAATGVPVEINLSATTLADAGLANRLERLAGETGADPRLIVIELTETALLDNDTTARTFVDRIRALGFQLALDDFGTGYGGFSYLKQLPVDYLKIDIEFVRDAVSNPASRHVIDAVVSLATAFGLQTIAEGVEDAATLELLDERGVDFGQGYHLGRPAPHAPREDGGRP